MWDRRKCLDKLRSEGGIRDKKAVIGIKKELLNLKIHEGTILLSQALVFVTDTISALQSQVSGQWVEIWRPAGATWTIQDRDENARLGGMG